MRGIAADDLGHIDHALTIVAVVSLGIVVGLIVRHLLETHARANADQAPGEPEDEVARRTLEALLAPYDAAA